MGTLSGIAVYLDDPADWDAAGAGPGGFAEVAAAYGGLEGTAGSPGQDSSVSAWVSLAGALPVGDLGWITGSSPPTLAVYPTADETMPTTTKSMTMLGFPSEWAGGTALYPRAEAVGLSGSQVFAIDGGDHYSAVDAAAPGLVENIAAFVRSVPSRR